MYIFIFNFLFIYILQFTAEELKRKQTKILTDLEKAHLKAEQIRGKIRAWQSFDSSVCGICGERRKVMSISKDGTKKYHFCDCKGTKEMIQEWEDATDAIPNLEAEAEKCGLKLVRAVKSEEDFQIPVKYADVDLNSCLENLSKAIVGAVMENLNSLSNGEGKNMVISGTTGTGKTYLVSAIGRYVQAEHLMHIGMISAVKLMALLKDFNHQDKIREVEQIASTIPLLIVDDVGVADTSTSWQKERLYSILNARYESQLPTIITTNLTLEGLERYLGEASYSRLCESGICIELTGKDRRKTS